MQDLLMEPPMSILRFRGHHPHLENSNATYFVTFRLAGSIPLKVLETWKSEKLEIIKRANLQSRPLSVYEKERLKYLLSRNIEKYLDELYGDCWLKDPAIAQLVVDALKFNDGKRYRLLAWCVMPNHVHVVFATISSGGKLHSDLIPILKSWKSFTAHQANKIIGRSGTFWQADYYDHLVRSDEELAHYIEYTLENPVKAKLCKNWYEWKWSGCSEKIRRLLLSD
jgi:REP element-mobilizing transposase RayT